MEQFASISVKEFCKAVGISIPTYYRLRNEGADLPDPYYAGVKLRFLATDVSAWFERRKADAKIKTKVAA